jgi:hypothetical protein
MKLLQLIFFMITIIGSSSAHSVTWIEYDPAGRDNPLSDSTDTATINDIGKIPRLKFLQVDKDCNDTYKFGVVILHGTQNGMNAGKYLSGTDAIVNNSSAENTVLNELMTWFQRKDVCALVVAPNATHKTSVRGAPRRWDTNNTLTSDIERLKLNNLINKVTSLTSEGVFLMGGSSGAIMAHNVSLNAINDGNTANLAGVVMVDAISAKQLCYDDCPPNENATRSIANCRADSLANIFDKFLDKSIETTGLISGKFWTLPTLLLYAKDDCTIPLDLKADFAEKIFQKRQSTVRKDQVGIGHAGDAWRLGTIQIKNGIRLVLPQLNLP